jgi:hypothetical protein
MQFHYWFRLHHFNVFFFSFFYLTFPFYLHLRDSSTTAPFYWDASPTLPPPASLPIFSSMVPFFFLSNTGALGLELILILVCSYYCRLYGIYLILIDNRSYNRRR